MPLAKRWHLSPDPVGPALPGHSPLESRILARRGVLDEAEARAFLDRSYPFDSDPRLMLDMDRAVERLLQARQRDEPVVVYGDYDADGVTAAILLYEWLQRSGFRASWYIPDRFQEGYGLNDAALTGLRADGADLVVTVDCGVRSVHEVEHARTLGLDIILTDHHLPGESLPPAVAVLNPKRPGDPYPFKGLSGVGLAFKLAQALAMALQLPEPLDMLDLVAVGTVADLAPLLGENRSLVAAGLQRLNDTRRPGLQALMETAGQARGAVTASSIAFGLAPRLNAAGRLASARQAAELLLARQPDLARGYSDELDSLNRLRQRKTEEAVALIKDSGRLEGERWLIFAADEGLHEGVIGLAASRIVEEVYRPVLLVHLEGSVAKGSARSIPEFDVTRALESCAELLYRFGGHESAAGFAAPAENLPALQERLERLAAEHLAEAALQPALEVDAEVEFPDLDERLMAFLDRLEPCGQDNPNAVFVTRGAEVLARRQVGTGGKHLKLTLRQSRKVFDAIAFRQGELAPRLGGQVDIAFRLERNEFRGMTTLQLNVIDIKPTDGPHWY
jgi:single-stranded-DNA-specific exonuclease